MPIHIHLKFGEKVKSAEEDKVMFKRISDKNGKKMEENNLAVTYSRQNACHKTKTPISNTLPRI